MVKQSSFFTIAVFCLLTISLGGQSLWNETDISNFGEAAKEDKMILPKHFKTYNLSFEALKTKLIAAPSEKDKKNGIEGILIELPMPNGEFETFEVYDSPVFAPKLAAKYPMIKSYKGQNIDKPGMNVRFDTGPYGLHAAIHDISNVYYIDPYTRNTTTEYLTYNVKDHISQLDLPGPLCGTHDDVKQMFPEKSINTRSAGPVPLHVYRFALACTGEWGAIRGTVANALADMNTGVNRINQIYENELAIRLVLIDNNELLLNFDSQTDPYLQVASGSDMLSANTNIVNLRVGLGAYDIGHVYHTNCDVGGIASLGSMCRAGTKAAAVTCHYSSNLDYMAAAVTSHEIGHQMSAQHTFNNCNGNESSGNAFEPGSGSTIMSYGGLCGGALNVVNNGQGDDYYHVASLIQIYNHTRDGIAGEGCAEIIETSNQEPTANILHEDGFYIPERTYFFLEGEGADDNEEDQLTYTWEQMNRGPSSPLGAPIGDAPHFRSLPPDLSPRRYFPSRDNIFVGNFDRTEVAFSGDRTVDFMFTVRDNNSEAGTAVWEPIQFHVVETPVKFEVTSQNSSETYTVGEETDVTWNVADTDLPPVNSEFVDIYLYTGTYTNFSFENSTLLAKNVFNSGSCKVIIPDEVTTQGRIIVKASESIFFSINKTNIKIDPDTESKLLVNIDPIAQIDCLPSNFSYTIESENYQGVEGNITYTVLDGLPEGAAVTFDPPITEIGATCTMTLEPVNDGMGGNFEIRIGAVTESQDTFSRLIYLNLKSADHSTVSAIAPEINATGIGISPEFSWEGSVNADYYTFELSASPTFGASSIISTTGITELTYKPEVFLEKNTVYYWRVVASNYCGDDNAAKIFAFNTEALFCIEMAPVEDVLPINISGSGKPTIQAPVEVTLAGSVSDINIKQFFGEHENNKDMKVSFISPDGKAVVLVSNKCEQQDFNCGFDDASDVDVKCPLNSGKVYAPEESLSAFNGDPLQGTWILQIEDTKSGNGGKLEGVQVEFCSSQVLDNPFIVRNEKIFLPWGGAPTITSDKLEVDDANNSSDELIYTIVEIPAFGELTFDGNPIIIGDQFSQQDINEDKLVYNALNENYETYFSFTVIDGEGGFIGITNFDINVDESTSIKDDLFNEIIGLYPNPAKDQITIDFSKSTQKYLSFEVINIQGQKVMQKNLGENTKVNVDVSLLSTGFYIINLKTEKNSIAKKIIIN